MQFVAFMFFSSLEYFSNFLFILVLFRFRIQENLLKFAVCSIVLSFVSNSLQLEALQAISPLVQAALVICFVTFVLRVHVLNASIMVITDYVIFSIVQWILVAIMLYSRIVEEAVPNTTVGYVVQAASAFMISMFAIVIYVQKGGFSFIDHSGRIKKSKIFGKQNRLFILFLLVSIIVIFIANFLFVQKHPPYLLVSIMLFLALLGLVYISVKRDKEHG